MKFLFVQLILFTFLGKNLFAQLDKEKIRKIFLAVEISTTDTSRASLYLKLGESYHSYEEDSAIYYLKRAANLYNKFGALELRAQSEFWLSVSYFTKGMLQKAQIYCDKALNVFQDAGDEFWLARTYNQKGNIKKRQGKLKDAIEFQLLALELGDRVNDDVLIARINNDLGISYVGLGNQGKALEFFQKSLIANEVLDNQKGICQIYNNIGIIHDALGRKKEALEYFIKCLEISNALDYTYGIIVSHCNIGEKYLELGNFQKSKQYLNEGLNLAVEDHNQEAEGAININLAELYLYQKQFDKSLRACLRGLEITKSINSVLNQKEAYRYLAIINDSLKNYKNAYNYLLLYKNLNDSIYSESDGKKIEILQAQYEKRIKRNDISAIKLLLSFPKLTSGNITGWIYLFVSLTIFILFVILGFKVYKVIRDNPYSAFYKSKNNIKLRNRSEWVED